MLSFTKVKQEAGKACMTASIGVVVAVFVTANINGKQMSDGQMILSLAIAVFLLVVSILLLVERTPDKPLPGKWKRIRVRKDTTIHVEEE